MSPPTSSVQLTHSRPSAVYAADGARAGALTGSVSTVVGCASPGAHESRRVSFVLESTYTIRQRCAHASARFPVLLIGGIEDLADRADQSWLELTWLLDGKGHRQRARAMWRAAGGADGRVRALAVGRETGKTATVDAESATRHRAG
jgi:hypothetical protein